jgi:hypothetical protein
MHPTTQLAHARLRRADVERHAAAARTRHQLVAARRARRAVTMSAAARARLSQLATPAPPACCPA